MGSVLIDQQRTDPASPSAWRGSWEEAWRRELERRREGVAQPSGRRPAPALPPPPQPHQRHHRALPALRRALGVQPLPVTSKWQGKGAAWGGRVGLCIVHRHCKPSSVRSTD